MLDGVLKALGGADKATGRTTKITLALPILAISLVGLSADRGQAAETTIGAMPTKLEMLGDRAAKEIARLHASLTPTMLRYFLPRCPPCT